MNYKIIRCSKCKSFQMTSAKKYLKCISCQNSLNVEKMKIFFESESPQEITIILKKIKEEYFKSLNESQKDFDEFVSAKK